MSADAKKQTLKEKIMDFFFHREKQQNRHNAGGFFGIIFNRLEIIMLLAMAVMAINLHLSFVDYISRSAVFISEAHDARFWFATRLSGSLIFVELILCLATSYFRYNEEWEKSAFATIIALVIAAYNHYTINEIFSDFKSQMSTLGFESIHNKMLLMAWLMFAIGEAVGFVMHSKGKAVTDAIVTATPVTNPLTDVVTALGKQNQELLEGIAKALKPITPVSSSVRDLYGLPITAEVKLGKPTIGFNPKGVGKVDVTATVMPIGKVEADVVTATVMPIGKVEADVVTATVTPQRKRVRRVNHHKVVNISVTEGFPVRQCPTCGKGIENGDTIVKRSPQRKYCSDACKQKAYTERRKYKK